MIPRGTGLGEWRHHAATIGLAAVVMMAASGGTAAAQTPPVEPSELLTRNASPQSQRDCRYEALPPPAPPEEEHWHETVLPRHDLFRPLLADMKEPRFYASYRYVDFEGPGLAGSIKDNLNTGVIAAGATFGLYAFRREHGCDGIQINLFGGIFSQFNLDSATQALINSDFQVGLPVTLRLGPWSARLRLYHQSSHLGDEFLLENPTLPRVEFSFEAVDLLISFEHAWWRVYAGAGVIVHAIPDLEPTILQAGAEARSERWWLGENAENSILLLAGGDITSLQARNWGATGSIKAGAELAHVSGRRLRILLTYLRGFTPFGQFVNTKTLQSFGVEIQFEP